MIERKSTKDYFAESLLELSKDASIDKISVRKICSNCGYSTKTFYSHFDSKYALIVYIMERDQREIFRQAMDHRSIYEYHLLSLRQLKTHATFFLNALDHTTGTEAFGPFVEQSYVDLMLDYIKERGRNDLITPATMLKIVAWAQGTTAANVRWLKEGMPISEEEMVQITIRLAPDDLRDFVENSQWNT